VTVIHEALLAAFQTHCGLDTVNETLPELAPADTIPEAWLRLA
jgi:hypothetical protein